MALPPSPQAAGATAAQGGDWAQLPAPVLDSVLSHLSLPSLCSAAMVCTAWHGAAHADSLWRSLLQARHGLSSTWAGSSSTCGPRARLMQLSSSSMWCAGNLAATIIARGEEEAPGRQQRTVVKGPEVCCLWAFRAGVACSGGDAADAPSLNRARCLPAGFSITAAAAAGRDHMVLLGCSGQVVDTRAAFVAATDHAQAAGAAAGAGAQAQQQGAPAAAAGPEAQGDLAGGGAHAAPPPALAWPPAALLAFSNPWQPECGMAIVSVAAGDSHVLAVTADGRLFGWGGNAAGQLGVGAHGAAWQPVPALLDGAWQECGDAVVAVACGCSHSVVLTAGGDVLTAGSNDEGQCGQGCELQQCSIFCQPGLLQQDCSTANTPGTTAAAAGSAAGVPGSSSSPTALPSPSPSPLPPPPPAAAIAAGPANTLIATRAGRVLVCGDAAHGQCGATRVRQGRCGGLVDVGPEVTWHGLARPTAAAVAAAGGRVAAALPRVVTVCAGAGSCYAVTEAGEVFAWGRGSQGQLGTGGCPKLQATPAKLPWAHHIRTISTSPTGQFAAAVDRAGRLYTWGAGKWGQLGHGDTSKRTVGRAVKQLRHLDVQQVCCGPECMLVLACQRAAPHSAHQHQQQQQQCPEPCTPQPQQGLGRSGRKAAAAAAAGTAGSPSHACDMSHMTGVPWEDVEGQGPFFCPAPSTAGPAGGHSFGSGSSSSSSRQQRRRQPTMQDIQPLQGAALAAAAAHADASPSGSGSGSGRRLAPAGQPQHSGDAAAGWDVKGAAGPSGATATTAAACVDLIDAGAAGGADDAPAQNAAAGDAAAAAPNGRSGRGDGVQRRRSNDRGGGSHSRGGGSPWSSPGGSSSGSSTATGSGAGSGNGGHGGSGSGSDRHPRMDKGFKRLLKRLLCGFAADPRQREVTFPPSLSASDRYHVHVTAEAYGLAHASHTSEGGERVIKVWKVSRTRRRAAAASISDSEPG